MIPLPRMGIVLSIHISTRATAPPSLNIQHGGRTSHWGRSPVDRSSAEVQAWLNLKYMTTLYNYNKRSWNKLPTRRFVPMKFKKKTLYPRKYYLPNQTPGASGRLTMKAHVRWLLQLWMVTNSHVLWKPMQSRNTLSKELDKSQILKGDLGKNERLGGLKTWKGGPGKN